MPTRVPTFRAIRPLVSGAQLRVGKSLLLLAAGTSWLGCGDLADDETSPRALAVIHGELSSVEPQSDGRVAMAVAWDVEYGAILLQPVFESETWDPYVEYTDELFAAHSPEERCVDEDTQFQTFDGTPWRSRRECEGKKPKLHELTEVVSYEPKFPLEFQIPIQRLPPEAARLDLSRLGGEGTFAMAQVVAFVDGDGDAKFDLGQVGQDPEEPLASSLSIPNPVPGNDRAFTHFWVVYLDGKINVSTRYEGYRDALAAIPQGFSIWQPVLEPSETPGELPERTATVLPIDTRVKMRGNPGLSSSGEFCETWHDTFRYVDKPFSSLPEDFRFCSFDEPNQAWFVEWQGETEYKGQCRFEIEVSYLSFRDAPADVPEGWPCPVE